MLRRPRLAAAVILGLATTLGACATSHVVLNPSWKTTPDGEAIGDAWPAFAQDAGIEGAARLVCTAGVDGFLKACRTDQVGPSGLGFEAAAMSLIPRFQANPRQVDGVATESELSFAVRFSLPPIEAIDPWTGSEPSPETLELARRFVARLPVGLLRGPNAVEMGGLDADRVEAVRGMVAQADRETRAEMAEAMALSLARTVSPAILEMVLVGNRRPPRPALSDAILAQAQDHEIAVTNRQNARLRELYCARYDCENPVR